LFTACWVKLSMPEKEEERERERERENMKAELRESMSMNK
jgi:hypothetical protein